MAETITENEVCDACGADVREGSLFCYSCGGSLASKIAVVKNDKNKVIADIQSQESVADGNGDNYKQNGVNTKQEIKGIFNEAPIAKPIEKSNFNKETKLESAAAMRKKSKSIEPKKVDVIWEEHENAPNVWFILVTIFLTILAAVILFLAIRMK